MLLLLLLMMMMMTLLLLQTSVHLLLLLLLAHVTIFLAGATHVGGDEYVSKVFFVDSCAPIAIEEYCSSTGLRLPLLALPLRSFTAVRRPLQRPPPTHISVHTLVAAKQPLRYQPRPQT
jgi:hypothetical protein